MEELELRTDERFALVFDLCPMPLALTSEEGRIDEANAALGRLLGLTPAKLAGRRLLDFTHPDDRDTSAAAGRAVLISDEGAEATMHKRYVTADGRTVHARVTMLLFDDPGGETLKLTQIEDVGDRRELERAGAEDPLTGVANRRELHRRLEPIVGEAADPATAVAAAGRRDEARDPTWAVVFVDLDDFKAINDAHGHRVGDEVLATVARRLRATTREPDVVARLGGDEFVVLLAVPCAEDIDTAVARIRASLARPMRVRGRTVSVRASIGVAQPRPDDSPQDVLERADRAMYDAKRAATP